MDSDLGDFKHIFLLDSIYGISTVSLDTWEQSKTKVAYCCGWIVLYTLEGCIIIYSEVRTNGYQELVFVNIVRAVTMCLPLYSLVKSILDYKTKLSVASNLKAIEKQLESNRFTVVGQAWMKVIGFLTVSTNIGFHVVFKLHIFKEYQSITHILEAVNFIQFLGTLLMQGLSVVVFYLSAAMIQKSITKGFCEVAKERQESLTTDDSHDLYGNTSRVQSGYEKKWNLLKELQGSLNATTNSIGDYFCIQAIWFRIMVEVVGPLLWLYWKDEYPMWNLAVTYSLFVIAFLSIELVVYLMDKEKENALWEMTKEKDNNMSVPTKQRKQQILAKLHRNRCSFSCVLFDVNLTLIATVLENLSFVITSLIGMNK